ncbi:MAG TPA: DUF1786 domain-containing protein [candidate division Zixibacteria bacterium]|nr:DUF1786 domain-containing protein [candidate division Zixibacteria bacterium]
MRVLCVDIGTGTQDIYLYDSQIDIENGFKLVVPAPTMIVRRKLQMATESRKPVFLSGVTMGGGPSHWAAEDHLKAGLGIFSTPAAARSFNDDLQVVEEMGITIVDPEDIGSAGSDAVHIEMLDFNFQAIEEAMGAFGVSLAGLSAIAVAVFDHGAAPPGYSDRRFRFDYIRERVGEDDRLSTFAFHSEDVPRRMTRLRSVVESAADVDAPLVLMDTAPAAVLGAYQDPEVSSHRRVIVANVGNFHTLAFQLDSGRIGGVFEHHTGLLNVSKLDRLLGELADGTISNNAVYEDSGHGSYIHPSFQVESGNGDYQVAITGPRRKMMANSALNPYFATPFGDMMLTGCFGLLASTAELLPHLADPIIASLRGSGGSGTPPWEIAWSLSSRPHSKT